MISIIQDNLQHVKALCRVHAVRTLELFGSAAKGTFDPATSDLDFVVDFLDYGPGIASRFIDFTDDLEKLFERPVDLVFANQMKNPYLRRTINAHREPLYGTERDGEAAA